MTARISLGCDGTTPLGAHCHRTYLSEETNGPAAAADASRLGWTRRLGRDLCATCTVTVPTRQPRPAFTPRHEETR